MTIPQFDIVIYHGNCYDGFASAWAARRHSPNAVFVPAQYGDAPPDVAGRRVLICDFSFPRDVLLRMRSESSDLLVLDHHKTASEDLAGLDFAIFDMERSGAGLTWDTLHPDHVRPQMIDYVEDRDLWRFRFPESRAFHAALSSLPMEFGAWDKNHLRDVHEVLGEGQAILRYIQQKAESMASRAGIVRLGSHLMRAINVPVEFVSETAECLKDIEPHLPILGFSWDGERNNYYCSLRSRNDGPDVSAIAREFGGGGHVHAAGFRVSAPNWHIDDGVPSSQRTR